MSETNETVDLWGDIVSETVRTPLTILKEQGALLERKTNGILTVDINSSSSQESFKHNFYLRSATLNYTYFLLSIRHSIEIYPIYIEFDSGHTREEKLAQNEEDFTNDLRNILQSTKTQKVISALLSQSAGV